MINQGTVLTLAAVKENKSNYPDQDCNRYCAARKLQETMGDISTKYILHMINKILIPNFLIIHDDLMAANDIFCTIIKALKVKTVNKSGEHVRLEIGRIIDGVLDRYKNFTLTADIMFVNKIIFLS